MSARRAVLVALLLAPAVAAAACGGSPSLPEPAPCVSPTPTPTPGSAQSSSGQAFRYQRIVTEANGRFDTLLANFRARWPENKFYRSSEFRESFVELYSTSTCLASALATVNPPANAAARFAEFDGNLEAILKDYQAAMDEGLAAVKKRNTSEYRDWARAMDRLGVRLDELLATLQN